MKLFCFLISLSAFSLFSCKKMGCTDENATNFDKSTQKNDGSCTYIGSIGIYFDSTKAAEYVLDSVQTLTYFVDGKEQATVSSLAYPASTPTCGALLVYMMNFDLGKAATEKHSLIVKRETGVVIDNYSMTVEGGKCVLFLMK